MSRNIFYVSNTQTDLFPHNKRTKFDQSIDIHSLDYIQQKDIEVAIKSVSFDNKRCINIEPDVSQPHFLIVQEIPVNSNHVRYSTFINTAKNEKGKTSVQIIDYQFQSNLQKCIDVTSSKDFIISDCDSTFMIEHTHENRTFSNVIMIIGQTAIHHIYMHKKEFFFVDSFINHINDVMKSITFYNDTPAVQRDFVLNYEVLGIEKYKLSGFDHRILIHQHIATILDIATEKISTKKLMDNLFSDQINCANRSYTALLYNEVYNAKESSNPIYHDIKKDATLPGIMKQPKLFRSSVYGIRSNISEPSISSSAYDTLVCMFQDNEKHDVLNIEFQNPTFFKTRKELLSYAHFDIVNLDTDTTKTVIPIGSPTYIQTVIQPSVPRMKRPFSIFLDSSCPISKKLYVNNANTDFSIELPERMCFRRNWTVALKTLHLPNRIKNIEGCLFIFSRWIVSEDGTLQNFETIRVPLRNASFSTVDSFVKEIKNAFRKEKVRVRLGKTDDGEKIKITYQRTIRKGTRVVLYMNNNLATILGYTSSPKHGQNLRFDENKEYIAPHTPNLHLLYPRNLIVACNIANDTIFGGQHVKLLRLITNTDNLNSDILSFDFLQDEKVNLGIREFKSIHISILDATGNPVKSESLQPTRLQLMFSLE